MQQSIGIQCHLCYVATTGTPGMDESRVVRSSALRKRQEKDFSIAWILTASSTTCVPSKVALEETKLILHCLVTWKFRTRGVSTFVTMFLVSLYAFYFPFRLQCKIQVESVPGCRKLDQSEKCSRSRISFLANSIQCHCTLWLYASRLCWKSGEYQNWRDSVSESFFVSTPKIVLKDILAGSTRRCSAAQCQYEETVGGRGKDGT